MSATETLRRNSDVASALAEARETYTRRRPQSLATHVQAAAAMPGGNTRTVLFHGPFPLAVARGEGARITDADGLSYVNMLGEYTAGLFGHSHPAIRAAVLRALDVGVNLSAHNLFEPRFAAAVTARFPAIERVRFTNSGTEANLMAIATAVAHTGRRTVLVAEGGYHGGVLYFGAGGSRINVPHRFVACTYNDAASWQAAAAVADGDLAAIIIEPLLGSGGCVPATEAFLRALRDIADQHAALLVCDEVMTSRLAPHGRAHALGVTPDLMTLGKWVGGGMSFGAFGGRAALMEMYDPRAPDAVPHAGTFNNNTLTMSAGLTALTELYTPEACMALNARGDALRARINAVARARGAQLQATGAGSMINLHTTLAPIRTGTDGRASDDGLKELLFLDLLERGFYMARRGLIALSLALTDADCDAFVTALDDALHSRESLFREG
jgi:glutamate-1-semialdehyde 2,1-aminomutase